GRGGDPAERTFCQFVNAEGKQPRGRDAKPYGPIGLLLNQLSEPRVLPLILRTRSTAVPVSSSVGCATFVCFLTRRPMAKRSKREGRHTATMVPATNATGP